MQDTRSSVSGKDRLILLSAACHTDFAELYVTMSEIATKMSEITRFFTALKILQTSHSKS
jgi:hypothetical protein